MILTAQKLTLCGKKTLVDNLGLKTILKSKILNV